MYPKQLLLAFPFLLLFPFLATAQPPSLSAYHVEITRHRAHEDSLFKHGETSPLTAEAKADFTGLPYFPIDEAYRVKANFIRTPQETIFQMPTTTSRTPEYLKYGELHFQLQGKLLRLNVYQNQELIKQPQYHTYLFIPFTDATTGHETYATGRYLDFSIPPGPDSVWLDFNKAYNPYCAYDDGYSCPIPPKENKLPIRVEAGVKTFEKKEDESMRILPTEILPEFPGGQEAMLKFLTSKFRIPKSFRKSDLDGKVIVSFVVKADGTLENFQCLKSPHPDLCSELERVIFKMPTWKPGTQNGRVVDVKYTIPFNIKF